MREENTAGASYVVLGSIGSENNGKCVPCSGGSSSAEEHSAIMTDAKGQAGFVIVFIHRSTSTLLTHTLLPGGSSGSSSAEVHSAIMTAAREQTGFGIAFIHRVNGGELLPEAYKVAGSGLGYITYGGPVPSEENN
eukprot:gene8975-16111_t